MAMQIRPTKTGKVTLSAGAVVPQEEDSVSNNVLARVLDSNVIIRTCNLLARVLFEFLVLVVGKDNEGSGRLDVLRMSANYQSKRDLMFLERLYSLGNAGNPCSYTAPLVVGHRCGMSNDRKAQQSGV